MSTPMEREPHRLLIRSPLLHPASSIKIAQEAAIKEHFEERIKAMEHYFDVETFPWDEIDKPVELWWSFPDNQNHHREDVAPPELAKPEDGQLHGVLTIDDCLRIAGSDIRSRFNHVRARLVALQQNIIAENNIKSDHRRHVHTLTPDAVITSTGLSVDIDDIEKKCKTLKDLTRRELKSILNNPDTSLKRSLTEAYAREFLSKLEVILEVNNTNPNLILPALKDLLKSNHKFHTTPLGIFQACDRNKEPLHRGLKALLCDIWGFIENHNELVIDIESSSEVWPGIELLIPESDPRKETLQSLCNGGKTIYQAITALSREQNLVSMSLYRELAPMGKNIRIKTSKMLAQCLNETSVEDMEAIEKSLIEERSFPDTIKHIFASEGHNEHALKWLEIHGLKSEKEFFIALLAANTPEKKRAVLENGKSYYSDRVLSYKDTDFLMLLLPQLTQEQESSRNLIKNTINITTEDGQRVFFDYLKDKLDDNITSARKFAKYCVSFSPELIQTLKKDQKFCVQFNKYVRLAFEHTMAYGDELKNITENNGYLEALFISAVPRNGTNINQIIEDFLTVVERYTDVAMDSRDQLPKLLDPNNLKDEVIKFNQRRQNIIHENAQTKLFDSKQFKGCFHPRERLLQRSFAKQIQAFRKPGANGDLAKIHPEGVMRQALKKERQGRVHPGKSPSAP